MQSNFDNTCDLEPFKAARAAEYQHLKWVQAVTNATSDGTLGPAGQRVARAVSAQFLWDKMEDRGAPLFPRHREVLEGESYSRQTFYNGRNQLIEAGLIIVEDNRWYATIRGGQDD